MPRRPLSFSGPLIVLALSGHKTETRRVRAPGEGRRFQPGDVIWMREDWRVEREWDDVRPGELPDDTPVRFDADLTFNTDPLRVPHSWLPGRRRMARHIRLPFARKATMRVTASRIERLADIDDAGAMAEGVALDRWADHTPPGLPWHVPGSDVMGATPRDAFLALWAKIHGPGAIEANPLVEVIQFERTKS